MYSEKQYGLYTHKLSKKHLALPPRSQLQHIMLLPLALTPTLSLPLLLLYCCFPSLSPFPSAHKLSPCNANQKTPSGFSPLLSLSPCLSACHSSSSPSHPSSLLTTHLRLPFTLPLCSPLILLSLSPCLSACHSSSPPSHPASLHTIHLMRWIH